MATQKRVDFYHSEEGAEALELLTAMAEDAGFNTQSVYAVNTDKYPDNLMSFVEKHMAYLNTHPNVETRSYISNLRLMTRIQSR